jgi:4-aminobutyrate aminotransferase/(S)-3-amino-2-methylpropionate transaminase
MVLSAVTGKAEIMDAPHAGGLGSTYGGHPLSCRASLAAFEIIEKQDLVNRAGIVGEKMRQAFLSMQEKHPLIGDVRGLGPMMAIELVKDRITKEPASKEAAALREKCYQNGVILLGAGVQHNVIRILVPLVITDEELEEGLAVIDEALGKIKT